MTLWATCSSFTTRLKWKQTKCSEMSYFLLRSILIYFGGSIQPKIGGSLSSLAFLSSFLLKQYGMEEYIWYSQMYHVESLLTKEFKHQTLECTSQLLLQMCKNWKISMPRKYWGILVGGREKNRELANKRVQTLSFRKWETEFPKNQLQALMFRKKMKCLPIYLLIYLIRPFDIEGVMR